MLANLKAKLEQILKDISGEARTEADAAMHDVETELAKVGPIVTTFKADLATLVADAEPAVKASITARADKLAADLAGVLKPSLVALTKEPPPSLRRGRLFCVPANRPWR
jgi:hypothetical protein